MAAPTWEALGLDPQLLHALNRRGLDKPTPVQVSRASARAETRHIYLSVARSSRASGASGGRGQACCRLYKLCATRRGSDSDERHTHELTSCECNLRHTHELTSCECNLSRRPRRPLPSPACWRAATSSLRPAPGLAKRWRTSCPCCTASSRPPRTTGLAPRGRAWSWCRPGSSQTR